MERIKQMRLKNKSICKFMTKGGSHYVDGTGSSPAFSYRICRGGHIDCGVSAALAGPFSAKKPLELILYFVLLQIPAYILVFYAMMCPGSGERTFAFAMGGLCWLIGILVLMQGIRDLLDHNTNKKDPPK